MPASELIRILVFADLKIGCRRGCLPAEKPAAARLGFNGLMLLSIPGFVGKTFKLTGLKQVLFNDVLMQPLLSSYMTIVTTICRFSKNLF